MLTQINYTMTHYIKFRTLNSHAPRNTRCQITCFGGQEDQSCPDDVPQSKNVGHLRDSFTLGARGLSCAVSGLGQCLYYDPREKPLEKSAVSLIAPSQWETCLNQFSPAFGLDSRLAPIDLPRVLCSNRLFDWFQE